MFVSNGKYFKKYIPLYVNELGEGISKSAQILNTTEEENAAAGANLF
jgi:hypothetical protein